MTDIARSSPDQNPRDIVSKHVTATTQNLIDKLRGRGCKRKKSGKTVKQKARESGDLQKRHFCLIYIIRILVAMSANTVSVISEFYIFTSKPVQTSDLETTEVKHKPIAFVNQSDLEFLIPGDNDTYIDLDIKFYIGGKLTKADGTDLDNTYFKAVTNNFLHSLLSQCSIALNGTLKTQAAELYNYQTFFETY